MRGVWIFLGMIVIGIVCCGIIPFVLMPGQGIAMALPVIMVPGEVLWTDFLGIEGLTITNTLLGTLLADVILLAFAFGATRRLKEVPGRLQGLFEVLTDALYGLARGTAGPNARVIFPLMATIFMFVLIANWIKLVPGFESVGLMHCAHEGINGYEKEGIRLNVEKAMDTGTEATEENYQACHHAQEGEHHDAAHEIVQAAVLRSAAQTLNVESISLKDDVGNENTLASYVTAEGGSIEAVSENAVALLDEEIAAAVEEGELTGAEAEELRASPATAVEEMLNEPYYRDDIYAVTPFLRGATTDLNLTLGLALIAVFAIQYFGVRAHGIRYFTKFINTPALERVTKQPMAAMDFVVGILELISELSRILSFGFRLFGNLFAGSVLLIIISFLVALLVPAGVYGLELFVGGIQAFVFAMLVLVFASMAMAGHEEHHD